MEVLERPRDKPPRHSASEILNGATVFVAARLAAATLLDYLEGGNSLDDFPTETRKQVVAALEHAKQALVENANLFNRYGCVFW